MASTPSVPGNPQSLKAHIRRWSRYSRDCPFSILPTLPSFPGLPPAPHGDKACPNDGDRSTRRYRRSALLERPSHPSNQFLPMMNARSDASCTRFHSPFGPRGIPRLWKHLVQSREEGWSQVPRHSSVRSSPSAEGPVRVTRSEHPTARSTFDCGRVPMNRGRFSCSRSAGLAGRSRARSKTAPSKMAVLRRGDKPSRSSLEPLRGNRGCSSSMATPKGPSATLVVPPGAPSC